MNNNSFFLDKDTFLHLRIPFSYFLLPIFCFGLSQAIDIYQLNVIIVFIALHFFIYPGSNIYNSYMDKDTGSIGGLKNPPPATKKLYYASILFDSIGLLLSLVIGWKMLLLMLVYVGVSKAYSWHKIRLKKYGITGWLIVVIFQGGYTFLLVNMAAENTFNTTWFSHQHLFCMLIATLLIGGFYPLTQIYQHDEDSQRGDYTISYQLGIIGTFLFSGILFLAACPVIYYYFNTYYTLQQFIIFIACLAPVIIYYLYWLNITWHNRKNADYSHTMRMTFISSTCMIICFTIIFLLNHI